MDINWVLGESTNVEVSWQEISEQLEINPNKELVGITIRCSNRSTKKGYYDALSIKEDLTEDKINGSEITYISIDSINVSINTIEIPIFAAVKQNKIIAVYLLTSEDIIGNDSNIIKMSVIDKVSGNLIATKTFQNNVDAVAYKLTHFGPVNTDTSSISPDSGLCLRIDPVTTQITIPKSVLVIEWNIS